MSAIQSALDASDPLAVVSTAREVTTLILRLGPGEALPERRHLRSDVVIQVMHGAAGFTGAVDERIDAPGVAFIPARAPYTVKNAGDDTLVMLLAITPGVAVLESRPYGSVTCPACSAEIPVEEGDETGDRFICPDCTLWMRLEEAERGYVAQRT